MSNTTFSGPVRSEGGFLSVVKNPVTGAITTTATFGPETSVDELTVADVVIFSGLPTSDPAVEGQLWNNLGVLTVSAG